MVTRWVALEIGTMKINVDAALFSKYNKACMCCVLRNERGEVIMAATSPERSSDDPLIVEFLAILQGLQLCLSLGLEEV